MRWVALTMVGALSAVLAGAFTHALHAQPGGESRSETLLKDMIDMKTTTSRGPANAAHGGETAPTASRSGWDLTPRTDAQVRQLSVKLSPEDARVILRKGTEPAFCGNLLDNKKAGVYVCKLCGLPLFSSDHKFDSGTGWPSFFSPFDVDHIHYEHDTAHGMQRVEILCGRCPAHLGHVFDDGPKPTGLRYCLNSASMEFVERGPNGAIDWPELSKPIATQTAYFGGGCFWGLEDRFQKTPGVVNAVSGYMGGALKNPTYKQVCEGDTGHAEVVKVVYDPTKIAYEDLLKAFFRYHDPTQLNRQGPDVGEQYRSAIFGTPEQVEAATRFIAERQASAPRFKGKRIVTEVAPLEKAGEFYKAEAYHQDYNERTGHQCYVPMYDDE